MAINYSAASRGYLDSARAAVTGLQELRKGPHEPRDVAAFYDDIRHGLKFAEVCASVALLERLEDLVEILDDGRLSADEVDQLVHDRTGLCVVDECSGPHR